MTHEEAPASLNDLADYYEVLDLKPDASPNEIRDAYFRAKATYQKDNVALYTLIDAGEREEMLQRIEEAYQILSSPEKRREYDRFYGQLGAGTHPMAGIEPAKVISIDRVPPMQQVQNEEELLIPPRTDFDAPTPSTTPSVMQAAPAHSPNASSAPASMPKPPRPQAHHLTPEMEKEIREQTDWSGPFLRRVREAQGVSLEEVTQITKVTKAYVLAIEEENYTKLPAPVFIRGFVSQLARLLKLPHQQVSASYMARYQKAHPEKFNR